MRSGTSNCHVRIGSREVDSPLVSRPNVLLALNEPSLRKFLPAMEPGGIVLYNSGQFPADCVRSDVRAIALPFTAIADDLGLAKVANMVVLGALLEATELLDTEQVRRALRKLVRNDRYYETDLNALERGREEARKVAMPVSDDYLWGV
jgi:Pyruvate/2-oxoacid:ferredoxin oxidoreductase gamma subunit